MYQKLARKGRRYRRNRTGPPGKGKLKVREGQELADRPQGINERREPGHVEIDLMFSGNTVWLTCVDRYTRKLMLRALPGKESGPIAEEVRENANDEPGKSPSDNHSPKTAHDEL